MGRKPTVNLNLPKGMRARRKPSGATYFYLDTGGRPRKEIPLGSDYTAAVLKWTELMVNASAPVLTFKDVADRYLVEVLPTKAKRTQADNLKELANLLRFFNDPPVELERIEPQHVRQYMDWRGQTAKTRANREKALLSHIWNFARAKGITALPNPCRGIEGFAERGRKDVYIEDEIYNAVYEAGNQTLRDALDLAYQTGQRPADVLRMDETHIRNNLLAVDQGKTGAKLRISLNHADGTRNELGALIDSIIARKRAAKVTTLALIWGRDRQRWTAAGLDNAFDRARAAAAKAHPKLAAEIRNFQFRDLRAKAGTDKADTQGLVEAQRQLGHASVTMTEHYVRRGNVVTPTR